MASGAVLYFGFAACMGVSCGVCYISTLSNNPLQLWRIVYWQRCFRVFAVTRPRAMAAFATDINFGPGAVVAIALLGIILLQSGGVASGTLSIPVIVDPGPVQAFSWLSHIIGHKLIPALPALLCWSAVPSNCQCLIAAIGEANKVLLQRLNTKGVGNFKCLVFSICTLSANIIFTVFASKAGG